MMRVDRVHERFTSPFATRTLIVRRHPFGEPPARASRFPSVNDFFQSGWTCDDVLARLPEHLDGELPPELDTSIREHLAVCSGCLARATHQRAFLRAVKACKPPKPATEAIRARIERSLRGGGRSEPGD